MPSLFREYRITHGRRTERQQLAQMGIAHLRNATEMDLAARAALAGTSPVQVAKCRPDLNPLAAGDGLGQGRRIWRHPQSKDLHAWHSAEPATSDRRVVINGAGAAGSAVFDLLSGLGVRDIIVHERDGILCDGGNYAIDHHRRIAAESNQERLKGGLAEAIRGANAFIGVSVAAQLTAQMVRTMAPNPVVLALANPVPEIMPEEAIAGGAAIVGTGRFDYANQCNNVLAFPALIGRRWTRAPTA